MAWRNWIPNNGLPTGQIADGSSKFTSNFTISGNVLPSDLTFVTTIQADNYSQYPLNENTYIIGDATNGGIYVRHTRVSSTRHDLTTCYRLKTSGGVWFENVFSSVSSGGEYNSLYFGIDDETQKATCFAVERWSNETFKRYNSYVNSSELYTMLKANEQVTYNWQSVPSISGKNGILQSLVQIKEEAINDGEPVSEATVLSFDSLGNINIPSVIDEQMPVDPSDVTSVTATYLIPALENGTYEGIKLLVKKGSIPTSEEDADKVVNLDEPTSILRIDSKSVGNLDEDSNYYFVVKLVDELGTEATSDPKDIWTSHSEGWSFDYTGEIQTFVAPKTGIYQLETWGAQGGNATDGTLTARGGYGAYATGEIFLTQGDTLYINVGGQNGYGGGGNANIIYTFEQLSKNLDFSHNKDYRNYSQGIATTIDDVPSEYYGTDWMLTTGQMNMTVPTYSNGTISLAKSSSSEYCTGSVFMPLDRTYIKKVYLTLTINDGYRVSIGVGKIVNNVVEGRELYYNTGTGSNIPLELDVNDYADYLVFGFGQQAVTITNISFLC